MLLQAVLAALGRCMPGRVLARIGKATYRCVERAAAQAVVLVQAVDAALGRSLLASIIARFGQRPEKCMHYNLSIRFQ